MKKMSPFWTSLLVVVTLGVPVEWCAKAIAIATTRTGTSGDSIEELHFSFTSLVPLAIAATASHRASKSHGQRAQIITIVVTLAVHGWCMYDSEGADREALAAHAWTGSALASGLAWMFSAVCVSAAWGLLQLQFALLERSRRS